MRVDRQALAELARFADKNAVRDVMRGIRIIGQAAEATDARMFARLPLALEPGEKPASTDLDAGSYRLPWALPPATGPGEEGQRPQLSLRAQAARLRVRNSRGDATESGKIAGRWPDASKCEPAGPPLASAYLAPRRLAQVAKFLAAASRLDGAGNPEGITVEIYPAKDGVTAPVVLRAASGAVVYLMPLRTGD